MLLIVLLISLVPAQAFATDAVTEDPTVISDVADAAAEEAGLTEDEPVPEGEVEIIPLPEEEYEEIVEEPEATEKPTADENGENESADGEDENSEEGEKTSEDGEDAEKDAEDEETEEDAEPEEDEDKLFPGMPEGYTLSAEQIAGKQALNTYGVVDTLCEATASVDYVDGEVFFLADTLEYAQTVAEAYGAELTEYASGVATLKLNGATVLDAVTAAADMSSNMPIVEANYIYKEEPVIETDGGDVSTYAYRDEDSGVSVKGSWTKWIQSTSNPDTYMSSPSNWDYQYMHDVVNTYEAWGVTKGKGVTVAVIDGGVGYNDDLDDNVIKRECANTWDEYISDHGTHVAGIIAAEMGNGKGGAGIAPEAQIYSERVFANDGLGHETDIIRGINNVINAKKGGLSSIKVMNMSIGGYGYSFNYESTIRDAINSGITVVVAMGNDGTNIQCYPAAYNIPGLIAVQSSNKANTLSSFSNYGAWADVTAPGSNIMSTLPNNGYGMMSGTSMAAPAVSGVCALYLSVYPSASPAQVEAAIKKATNNGIVDASKLFNAENKAPIITAKSSKRKDGSLPYGSYINIKAADSSQTLIYTIGSQTPSIKNGVVTGTVVEGNSISLQLTSANGFTVGKNVSVKAAAVNGFGMMSKVKTLSVKVGYANPTSVEIIDAPETLIPGKSFTLSAKVSPAEASQKIIWSVDKGACAGTSISKTGALKSGKNDKGTITVYARSEVNNAKLAKVQIKIAPVDPTKKINILWNGNSQKTLTLGINSHACQSVSLTTVSYKASAPTVPVYNEDFAWKSSNTKVATVDEDGTVKAVGTGSATITCTAKDGTNVKATQAVKVAKCADEMSISGFSTVAAGKTAQYKADLSPKTVNFKTVEWSIDANKYGIKIDSRGKVTVPAGTPKNTQFTIRAKSGPTASAEKTVTVSASITQVKITKIDSYFGGQRTYAKDGSLKQATLFSTNAFDGNSGKWYSEINLGLKATPTCEVEWTSSNEKVAIVNGSGCVKAVAAGTAKITCKATDAGRKSASVNIVVVNPASSITAISKETIASYTNTGKLVSGKSARNIATLGDAYGTPTIKKVQWYLGVEAHNNSQSGWSDATREYDCTNYAIEHKLISINKNSGQLTASKNAWKELSKKYGDYTFLVFADAYTTDGSQLGSSVPYQLISAPISKLQVSYNRRLYTSISISCLYKDGYCIDLPVYGDGYSFDNFTIKSSKPDVAGAILTADRNGYPVVRIISGHKAGTATITLTAADGSNKKATVKIKVK